MLDQNTDKTLDGSKSNTVDHDRTMFLAVSTNIFTIKTERKLEIKLDSTTLPGSSDGVLKMEVNLRSVERSVSLIYYIIKPEVVKSSAKSVCSHLPVLITSHGIFRTCGKLYVIFETKQLIYLVNQFCNPFDLLTDLLRHHKDVGIILCEAAYTHKSVKLSGFFMTMYQTKLTHTKRQITVRTWF